MSRLQPQDSLRFAVVVVLSLGCAKASSVGIEPPSSVLSVATDQPQNSCSAYPVGLASWRIPGALRRSPVSSSSSPTAIVLIHGFQLEIGNCNDFARKAESGEVYFKSLLPIVERNFGLANRILVFTYPTFNSFDSAGARLADILNDSATNGGVTKVILLGHSMGGLVARSATFRLRETYRRPSLVSAIVTLGTPHDGIAKVNANFYKVFGHNEGVNSLVNGLRHRHEEEAPIFAFAGELAFPVLNRRICTDVGTTGVLGGFYSGNCVAIGTPNDGLIEVVSALPSFISAGTAHLPTFVNYDHSEMKTGNNGTGNPDDGLLKAVVADIQRFASVLSPSVR